MRKLFILGASGLVGKALVEECKDGFDIYGTYSSSALKMPEANQYRLQINEIDKMKDIVESIKPDAVISCLRGDFDQQLIFHKELALIIKNIESILYYFSTANVFDGDFSQHHSELDTPNATSPYGKFKINCENTLQEILNERAVILRIPQIWGEKSPRMDIIKSGIENNHIDVYSNLECNNLSDTLLAKQLKYIMENKLNGIFHLGSVDMMTHERFIGKLAKSLTYKELHFNHSLFQQITDNCYFGLKSYRNDIPKSLQQTNAEIISDLVS
ncbi:sugar nucleotide-binding protein [Paenisporosarcina indica]|uniref:sugar nucleotide-binding protein n=1 Tax=Paenisporosarcina indica TaxID=650093 RepID=UPI00094F8BBF|nr:sugar nucleotide-binding protein [Paenisporosarcina indica]